MSIISFQLPHIIACIKYSIFCQKLKLRIVWRCCTAGGRVARFSLPDRPTIHRATRTQPAHVNIYCFPYNHLILISSSSHLYPHPLSWQKVLRLPLHDTLNRGGNGRLLPWKSTHFLLSSGDYNVNNPGLGKNGNQRQAPMQLRAEEDSARKIGGGADGDDGGRGDKEGLNLKVAHHVIHVGLKWTNNLFKIWNT